MSNPSSPRQNPKNTKLLRQELRNDETPAERLLWRYLRGKQLNGYRFRRQHGIGSYILDFYCPSGRLGIELDGNVHEDVIRQEYDLERTKYLKEMANIRIVRFDNEDVLNHIEAVIEKIQGLLEGEEEVND